jgi:hypothetical protein
MFSVNYDERGKVVLTHMSEELKTAQKFVAYMIDEQNSTLQLDFVGNESMSVVQLSVREYTLVLLLSDSYSHQP